MPQPLKRDGPLHSRNCKLIAALGEELAHAHLLGQGYKVVDRNWRCGRFGEIDLIASRTDGVLVFVEVKTRKTWTGHSGFIDYGFNAIDWRKRRKILIAARSYLARKRCHLQSGYQCDAILVTYRRLNVVGERPELTGVEILHVPNAFC